MRNEESRGSKSGGGRGQTFSPFPVAHCCLICFSFFYVHILLLSMLFMFATCERVCVRVYGCVWVCSGTLRAVSGQTPYIFVITSVLCKYFQLFASFLLLFQRTRTHTATHTHTCVTLRPFKRGTARGLAG